MNVTCPRCQIVNPANIEACRGCGVAFAVVPIQKKSNLPALLICLAILFGCGICGSLGKTFVKTSEFTNTDTSAALTPTDRVLPSLKLLSMKQVNSSEMYFRIIGEVQNDSADSLRGVTPIVTIYDKNGNLLATESGSLDFSSLTPDQISAFTVVLNQNPAMNTYKITFKNDASGSVINFSDARSEKVSPKKKR